MIFGVGLVVGLMLGVLLGLAAMALRSRSRDAGHQVARARLEQELASEREKAAFWGAVQDRMKDSFTSLAHQALATNSEQLLVRSREQLESVLQQVRGDWGTHKQELKGLVDPLSKALDAMDQQVRTLEQRREGAYQSLGERLRELGDAQSQLRQSTVRLEQSLKTSTARGRWGELQLRRVVELAGMTKHISFSEQITGEKGRPDMIVHLPNNGILPIDAKAPATAYMEALEREGEARRAKLAEHAKALRGHILELSRKAYMEQFERAPEIVVLFVPFESALSSAFEQDPDLLEYGIQQRILVASPVTLLALLRSVAFGWQQHQLAENARQIADQGRELYARFLNVMKPVSEVGDRLGKAVDAYNQAVGSMESRLMPALRRLQEVTVSSEDPPSLATVDQQPRAAPEISE